MTGRGLPIHGRRRRCSARRPATTSSTLCSSRSATARADRHRRPVGVGRDVRPRRPLGPGSGRGRGPRQRCGRAAVRPPRDPRRPVAGEPRLVGSALRRARRLASSRISPAGRPLPSRTPGSTNASAASPRPCSTACCRSAFPTSPAWPRRRDTSPGPTSRSGRLVRRPHAFPGAGGADDGRRRRPRRARRVADGTAPQRGAGVCLRRQAAPGDRRQSSTRCSSDAGPEQMATMLFAVLDTERSELVLVNAGHPPPVVLHRDGTASFVDRDAADALRRHLHRAATPRRR